MPVKNYVSRNGQVEYEYDDLGDILTYGRDALGNVVAGYDAATNAVFTADYKPYGEFAATTGNVAGRRFMWVGSWGYRFTSGVPVSHYVRARHLSMRMGMWTSVDPLWPSEPAFGYVGGGVTRWNDPSGHQPQVFMEQIKGGRCCEAGTQFRYDGAFDSGISSCSIQRPNAKCKPLAAVLQKCGISLDLFCRVVDTDKCCEVARRNGADPNSICAIALAEQRTRNPSNFLQDGGAAFGIPIGQSFGCLQIQIQRARFVLEMERRCGFGPSRLAPLTTKSSDAQIARQLLNCEYSLTLASVEQRLRASGCHKRNARLLPRDPVKVLDGNDYSNGFEFALSWNARSDRHVRAVKCVYFAIKAAGMCE